MCLAAGSSCVVSLLRLDESFFFLDISLSSGYTHTPECASVVKNGGDGFMYFQLSRAPGIHPPPGGYTAQDEEAMEMIGKLSQDEKAYVFFEWILKKGVPLSPFPLVICSFRALSVVGAGIAFALDSLVYRVFVSLSLSLYFSALTMFLRRQR